VLSRHVLAVVAAIAVACLTAVSPRGQPPVARDRAVEGESSGDRVDSTGSGLILTGSGYIVTNHHIVEGATALGVRVPGREKPAAIRVVAEDIDDDLAIVKADGAFGTPPISLMDPKDLKVGQNLILLGYPIDVAPGQSVRASTVTLTSIVGPRNNQNVYQIGAPTDAGNSGGPVFNGDGQLVGIAVSQFVIKTALVANLLQRFPDGADVLRHATKLTGTREQQIESASRWVVQILKYRPAITTASREYHRSPAASTRVDLLAGKLSYWMDLGKWSETNPIKSGVPQQFVMMRGQALAGVMIELDPSAKPIDEMRARVMKEARADMPDAQIISQEERIVNGLPTLVMQIEGTSANGPIVFFVQLYTGPEGSVRTSAYTDRRNLEIFKTELDAAMSGLEKPKDPSLTSASVLSSWTRTTLRQIDSPMLIRVVAREADIARRQKVLSAYQDAAPQIHIEYIDPDRSVELVRNMGADRTGLAEFSYKGRRLRSTVDAEVDVTKTLMRLHSGPQKVYFTQAHAEHDLAAAAGDGYSTLATWLDQNNFKLERLGSASDARVPADAAVVVAAGPRRDFSAGQVASLKNYLAAGGHVILLLDPPAPNVASMPNLLAFAHESGIEVGAAVTAEGPYAVATTYAPHPATMGFREPVAFPTARTIAARSS
jgi:Trypsin-like peptidase domain/ABC-type uncharacterized transport system